MLTAMNTGHDGSLTTLHANSPADILPRVVTMVRYGVDLPVDVIEANAASAFDVVVQTTRSLDGSRYVTCVAEFEHAAHGGGCGVHVLFERTSPGLAGTWKALPRWIDDVPELCGIPIEEVKTWEHRLHGAA